METYTEEGLIKDMQPVFGDLMSSKAKLFGKLLNKYEEANPGKSAKIVFKVEFKDDAQEKTI